MRMLRTTAGLAVLTGVALAAPAALAKRAHHAAASKSGTKTMTEASLKSCTVKSAIINLVPEDLLTRTAITKDTIDGHARPVSIAAGDPRIARLNTMLHGLTLKDGALPQIEMRTLIRLTCEDGTTRTIAGSKTQSDGTMHLDIDGTMARTDAPVRHLLDAMVAEHAH